MSPPIYLNINLQINLNAIEIERVIYSLGMSSGLNMNADQGLLEGKGHYNG